MMRVTNFLLAVAVLFLPANAGLAIDDQATAVRSDEHGAWTVREVAPAIPAPGMATDVNGAGAPMASLRGGVVWQRTLTDATYTTCAILAPAGSVAAATYLNPPKEVEVLALEGVGNPDWVYPGDELYVSASSNGDVVAGVDVHGATQSVTVHCWGPGSSVPLWSTDLIGVTPGAYRTVAVSADGSTIAVLVTVQPATSARLFLYTPASSVPIGTFDGVEGFGRNVSIGADGRFTAFVALAHAYVVDRDAAAVRWSGSMGASNDPIAISTDGSYLAYGWTSLEMRSWNGTAYALLWSRPGSGYALKSVTFSGDGSTFAAGWYRNDFLRNRINYFTMPVSTPAWTYDYLPGTGLLQDVPYDLALTPAGEFLAVGGWGDQSNTNPEVHLFAAAGPTPVLTVDTPGSLFDIDVVLDSTDGAYVTACGKHVHANTFGRGGDLFSIHYTAPVSVAEGAGGPALLTVEPLANPFPAGGAVRLVLAADAGVDIGVYSAAGARVRDLFTGHLGAGAHTLRWDGRTERATPASPGVYFLRAASGGSAVVRRAVLLR